MSIQNVLVIGGGIGGLVLANALKKHNMKVHVYEQADEFRALGGGLSLWVNALKMLDQIELGQAVREMGSPIETIQARQHTGDIVSELPVGKIARQLGGSNAIVHRGDLQKLLVDALDEEVLHLGATCVDIKPDDQGVTAHFADGREARSDVLVGADGIHSIVRRTLFGDDTPRYAGYTAWLGVARYHEPRLMAGVSFESWGKGTRVGVFPLPGERVYWYALQNQDAVPLGATPGKKSDVLRFIQNWHEPVEDVIRATADEDIVRIGIYDRKPLKQWSKGRATLLGDAAHPMTPNLGQGACQAIEDAVTLAACLCFASPRASHYNSHTDAFQSYERQRLQRANRMVTQSWQAGIMSQLEHPAAIWLRNTFLKLMPDAFFTRQYEAHFRYEIELA